MRLSRSRTGSGEAERIALRRQRALEGRAQGGTIRQIAHELDCSVGTISEDIAAELTAVCQLTKLAAEHVRQLELERSELALRGLNAAVMKGDPSSCRAWIRCLEYRAKLLGIIKPTNVQPGDELPESELSEREIAMRVAALLRFAETGVPGGGGKNVVQ